MKMTNQGKRNLYLHTNGFYYIRFVSKGQVVTRSLKTKDFNTAIGVYNLFLQKTFEMSLFGQAPVKIRNTSRIRIDRVLREWLESAVISGYSKSSMEKKELIKRGFKDIKIKFCDEIGQQTIDSFYQQWTERGLSEGSQKSIEKQLRAFLNYLIKKGFYSEESKKKIVWKKLCEAERGPQAIITEEEYQTILNACQEDKWKMYLKTLWETSLRPKEALLLKRENIHFDERAIWIFQSKTKKWKSFVLREEFRDELLKYCENNNINNFLFNQDGFRYKDGIDDYMECHGFEKIRNKLGLRKEVCLYSFRISHATKALKETGNIEYVRNQLGHTNLRNTQKYTKFIVDDRLELLDNAEKKQKRFDRRSLK